VVSFKRGGIPLAVSGSARASLDGSEIGPVIHIITPQRKETSAAEEVSVQPWGRGVMTRHGGGLPRRFLRAVSAFEGHVVGRDPGDARASLSEGERRELEAWETFDALATLTRQFNREAAALAAPAHQSRVNGSLDALFAPAEPAAIDAAAARQCAIERAPLWCRLYAIADALAQERQAQFKHDWLYVYAFAF